MSRPNEQLELLALRLGLYGEADRRLVRSLARSTLWLETRNLLREHGFTEAGVNILMGGHHPIGCPCWRCVWKLNRAARDHRRRLLRQVHDLAAKG